MEVLNNEYVSSEISREPAIASEEQKYILWFFRLLAAFIVLMIVLLSTVKINDTVEFTEGEIIASSPQADFKAAFEAQLININVQVGQKINTDDTLMVIYNEQITRDHTKQKAEREYLEKKLASVKSLLSLAASKKNAVGLESSITSSQYNLDVKNIMNNIQVMDKQYSLEKQKLESALERNKADSILYKKDMLSKMELNSGRDATNSLLGSLNSTSSQMQQQSTQKELSANNYLKEQHNIKLKKMQLAEDEQRLNQLQIDLENQLIKANENLKQLQQEIAKQYLIATAPGVVNFIYNSKQSSNLINKGDLLMSISPHANKYYAKAAIPQKDIQYVGTNMQAHLKLDAYHHLKHGIIKGKVNYITERKENEKFYAFIQLNNNNGFQLKSGYNITGEIITERLVLFHYFTKKLFKQFDKKQP